MSKNTFIPSIKDFELNGKRVFMRLDFNVPLSDPDSTGSRTITDDTRIQEALPTIQYAIEKGAKIIIGSHLGRPDGQSKPEFSLEPVAAHLASLLKKDVTLSDDCVGDGIELSTLSMKHGQVMLLENLRFHKGEEANDSEFAHQLSKFTDIYVNDAFGTSHRKHASTYGLASIAPKKTIGFLIEKELRFLDQLLDNPAKPFYTVLGGSKVTDKIATIDALLKRVQGIAIGGAMAHAFWAAEGKAIPDGAKKPKQEDIKAAAEVLKSAREKDVKILTPVDTNLGFDIGPETIKQFIEFLSNAKTIFWNGPLGWFEKKEYSAGTFELARALAKTQALKVVGGGDTVSAIKQSGYSNFFDHLSTGGGAVLEYLEGRGLPGIDILKQVKK